MTANVVPRVKSRMVMAQVTVGQLASSSAKKSSGKLTKLQLIKAIN